MTYILTFFLLLILCAVAAGAVIFLRVRRHLQSIADQFQQQTGAGKRTSEGPQASGRRTTTPSGEEIIDLRDPEKVQQKIFKSDEGEYVDYTEEGK
jgi:nucleoid-associated protein YgaU